jgi:hypothetical protein
VLPENPQLSWMARVVNPYFVFIHLIRWNCSSTARDRAMCQLRPLKGILEFHVPTRQPIRNGGQQKTSSGLAGGGWRLQG